MADQNFNPTLQFAQQIQQGGVAIGLDFLKDKAAANDLRKQRILAAEIGEIFGKLADPSNPMDPRQGIQQAVNAGNKIGLAPSVSVGLYNAMGQAASAGAQKRGMSANEFIRGLQIKEQVLESRQRQVKRGLDIEKQFRELSAPVRGALNEVQAVVAEARQKAGPNASFEQLIDELGETEAGLEASFISFTPELNKVRNATEASRVMASNIVKANPEVAQTVGFDDLAKSIEAILQGRGQTEKLIRGGGAAVENAPTPNTAAKGIVASSAGL